MNEGGPAGPTGYEPVPGWGELPDGWSLVEVAGVAADSRDRVYVFNRGEHPVIQLSRDGEFLGSWGEGRFTRPHGLQIGPDDAVYCTDDQGQTVRKFTPEGDLLLTMGTEGRASDTGVVGNDYRTIRTAGPPFNYPTNLALGPDGSIYVSDGYGNARVHRFGPGGELIGSWGEPGAGPGQFHLPHGIAVRSDGTVFVADRENSRLQLFSPTGEFLEEWTDLARPCQVYVDGADRVYVAELGFRVGIWPGSDPYPPGAPGGRVSIYDRDGQLMTRWGGDVDPRAPDGFLAPHDIWVDSRGDVYVGEVIASATRNSPLARECPALRKFRKLRS